LTQKADLLGTVMNRTGGHRFIYDVTVQ